MSGPLHDLLPPGDSAGSDELLGRFLDYVAGKGLTLYPAQEEAILELFEGKNVILNTPTGSGKSLVASALHFASLAHGRRSVYTCPIKALVNEKWMALCRELGPENVGLSTGDATVNRDAPVLCCTAEVLANIALREGEDAWVDDVVMDEFHWYADRDRGVAWQVPLLTLPRARFLLMSATLGDVTLLRRGPHPPQRPAHRRREVRSSGRCRSSTPTPRSRSPRPSRSSSRRARRPSTSSTSRRRTPRTARRTSRASTSAPARRRTRSGPRSPASASRAPTAPTSASGSSRGSASTTRASCRSTGCSSSSSRSRACSRSSAAPTPSGVGINVPIRTVLFSRLCKFDGQKTAVLSARDFHQIAGRAGRKGFDDIGFVVAQAPEHVIENLRLGEKAKDGKKVVKRKPPEHNFANWDLQTLKRLMGAPPERLTSRFQVSHGMLLNVLSRRGDGCRAMQRLIRDSHEPDRAKKAHFKRAWQLFRALVERGIVEYPTRHRGLGRARGLRTAKVRVNVDLQDDFSMDQALSLYLLETIPLLDPESETHALDLLTLVESILENPELILRRQLDKLKGEAVAKMKAEGLDYDQRMEQLEKLEYPKPLRDFVYGTFNAFADRHPWVGEENIRPKSIAREMFEGFRSFSDYVQEYDLERAEGLLLRHLNSVYKVLGQTVPDGVKTDTVREMELYLRDMLRGVDSSLLDEWERMRDPDYRPLGTGGADLRPPRPEEPPDVTRDVKAFTAAIRTRVFSFLRAWSIGDDEAALEAIDAPGDGDGQPWTVERLRAAREAHRAEHAGLRLDPEARNLRHTHVQPSDDRAALARAADARGPGGPQRLGGGARRGPRRLARAGRAGAEAAAPRQPGLTGPVSRPRPCARRPPCSPPIRAPWALPSSMSER